MLRTAELNFTYPEELVATKAVPRGQSRILHVSRDSDKFEEISWQKFFGLFQEGDTLVLNDSRVLWARLLVLKPSGGQGEIFFLGSDGKIWNVLARNLNLKEGGEVLLPGDLRIRVIKTGRICQVEALGPVDTKVYFEKWGQVPLPPYITSLRSEGALTGPEDRERYQTVWAKKPGSVAAPTAGLHFTAEHLEQLEKKGVKIATVTLHVGAGTFLPVDTEILNEFEIHSEVMEVGPQTCDKILKTQAAGKRVWACGTTALRALETAVHASPRSSGRIRLIAPFLGETRLFVTPGYRFQVVDGLLTNFHQPQSSLLALAAAFATREPPADTVGEKKAVEKILKAYKFAIEKKFRLFSYGDLTVIS